MSTYIERQNLDNAIQKQEKKIPVKDRIKRFLYNKTVQQVTLLIIISASVPILMYFFFFDKRHVEKDTSSTCMVKLDYRVPCGRANVTFKKCTEIKCCFDDNSRACYHYLPSKYNYAIQNKGRSFSLLYSKVQDLTPFGNKSVESLKLSTVEISESKLQVIVHDPSLSYQESNLEQKNYDVKIHTDHLSVEVFRKGSDDCLLTTSRGPLIASERYWEWTFQMTTDFLFGLGQLAITGNETVSKVIYKNQYDHNTLPIFMGHLKGRFHGVVVDHDGPLEVTVLPSKLVILRSLSGRRISLTLVTGPTPKEVVMQLRGSEFKTLPYWTLGAHICREGNATILEALEEYKSHSENASAVIKFASDCIHDRLFMMLKDVLPEHNLAELIDELRAKSHFTLSIPPQIIKGAFSLYNKSVELDILYKQDNGKDLNGSYAGNEVVFPDYAHKSIQIWLDTLIENLNLITPTLDGLVLTANWPQDDHFQFNDSLAFPYMTTEIEKSMSHTLNWNSSSNSTSRHISEHNNYGFLQAKAFQIQFPPPLPIWSASYHHGAEFPAVIQNLNASWTNLKAEIGRTLYHGLFGSPYISTPVCGSTSFYNNKSQESLCTRWYLTAASFSLFRISSDLPRRDPLNMITGYGKATALEAISKRHQLLPYYFTVLSGGEPLARPMFYNFPENILTYDLDEQYMVGDALLVAQPLVDHLSFLRMYLPPEVGIWYEFWGGKKYDELGWIQVHVLETDWIMFIAQGSVIPIRNLKSDIIGEESLEDTFTIYAALNCNNQTGCGGNGSMSIPGPNVTVSLDFEANITGLTVRNVKTAQENFGCASTKQWPTVFKNIKIFGLEEFAVLSELINYDLCNATTDEIFLEYNLV